MKIRRQGKPDIAKHVLMESFPTPSLHLIQFDVPHVKVTSFHYIGPQPRVRADDFFLATQLQPEMRNVTFPKHMSLHHVVNITLFFLTSNIMNATFGICFNFHVRFLILRFVRSLHV